MVWTYLEWVALWMKLNEATSSYTLCSSRGGGVSLAVEFTRIWPSRWFYILFCRVIQLLKKCIRYHPKRRFIHTRTLWSSCRSNLVNARYCLLFLSHPDVWTSKEYQLTFNLLNPCPILFLCPQSSKVSATLFVTISHVNDSDMEFFRKEKNAGWS